MFIVFSIIDQNHYMLFWISIKKYILYLFILDHSDNSLLYLSRVDFSIMNIADSPNFAINVSSSISLSNFKLNSNLYTFTQSKSAFEVRELIRLKKKLNLSLRTFLIFWIGLSADNWSIKWFLTSFSLKVIV